MTGRPTSVSLRTAQTIAALLATTILTRPGLVLAQVATGSSSASEVTEVVVTASKRAENIQNVAASIQALDTRMLERQNVNDVQDYLKLMPSVSAQGSGPANTDLIMRGVSSGSSPNHSGSLPTVGTYLDEQPVTTIGGTLNVHIYDMARIEVLPGPQGTLYGASSEAGTLRLITNAPSTAGFSAGYDVQGNSTKHGGLGGVVEGFVNLPISETAAVRLVAFDEHDAGYIDNIPGTRTYATSGATINNSAEVKKNFNSTDTFGGRAAAKIELGDNWTVSPSIIAQEQKTHGVYGYEEGVGELQVQNFGPAERRDRWAQAALTVNGKIGNFDLVYSGGYMTRGIHGISDYTDYSIFYDNVYGSGVNWLGADGQPLADPSQQTHTNDSFTKESHEIRLMSPGTDRFHFIVGAFYQKQTHHINLNWSIDGFSPTLSVPGYTDTIYATNEDRTDKDTAAFAEATFNITDKLHLTGGIRGYHYDNSLEGFYGYSANYSALSGFGNAACLTSTTYRNAPCKNLDKSTTGSGETHRINLSYQIDPERMVYATYSTGFRPGGINRALSAGSYDSDTLTNYEVGAKTAWFDRRLIANVSAYYEKWNQFQFSFLGLNNLTVIQNAPKAEIKGVEANLTWAATDHLSLSGGGAYNDAKLPKSFCGTNATTGAQIESCADSAAIAPKGTKLPYTAPFKGNLTARYTFTLGDWNGHAQASVFYQGKTQAGFRAKDIPKLGYMPSYDTEDLSVGLEKNNLAVELFAKNIFDSSGELGRYSSCTLSVCTKVVAGVPKAIYVTPVHPQLIGLKVSQRF